MKQEYFLKLARRVSQKSDHRSHKLGCVIARGNRIVSTGFNLSKSHPHSPHPYGSIHAEFQAALKADYDLHGTTVYVFREHKDGTWANSKPCSHCHKFLVECGAKKVVYSFEGSFKQEDLE